MRGEGIKRKKWCVLRKDGAKARAEAAASSLVWVGVKSSGSRKRWGSDRCV